MISPTLPLRFGTQPQAQQRPLGGDDNGLSGALTEGHLAVFKQPVLPFPVPFADGKQHPLALAMEENLRRFPGGEDPKLVLYRGTGALTGGEIAAIVAVAKRLAQGPVGLAKLDNQGNWLISQERREERFTHNVVEIPMLDERQLLTAIQSAPES